MVGISGCGVWQTSGFPMICRPMPAVRAFTDDGKRRNPQVAFMGNMPISGAKTNQFVHAALRCVMPIYWAMFIRHIYRTQAKGFVFTFKSWGELLALLCGMALLLYICLQPCKAI